MGILSALAKFYMWVTSTTESMFSSGEIEYTKKLDKDIETLKNPYDIVQFYKRNGFKWRSDAKLFGITLDHARKPWLTYKKKQGDCEDFMLLSEYIIQKIGITGSERWAVEGEGQGWHAILIFPFSERFGLLSNTEFRVLKTKDDAIKEFYGNKHKRSLQI